MTKILILLPALLFNIAFTQNIQLKDIVGVYSDESIGFHMTELKLKDDYTFSLETIDPVFPYTHQYFKNYGKFKIVGDEVILNPDKTPRTKKLELIQSVETENEDSILIEINYFIEKYKNEKLIDKEQIEFELLTIFINKKKYNYHIIQKPKIRKCAFGSKIKNQVVIDSFNQIKIEKDKIERIGIYSYGFDEIIWYKVSSSQMNKFKFIIEQPIDEERMPRSKKVKFKKNKAFFYEWKGEVDKSSTPLIKKN